MLGRAPTWVALLALLLSSGCGRVGFAELGMDAASPPADSAQPPFDVPEPPPDAPPDSSGGVDAGPPGCTDPLTNCGGVCVDLERSRMHCGSCGNACAAGQVCSAHMCTTTCAPEETLCAGECTDLTSDPRHCHLCGNECPPTYECVTGICANDCDVGETACGPLGGVGSCADLRIDPLNCGDCGVVCPELMGSRATCVDALCGFACLPGYADCGPAEGCETPLGTEADCASCGDACLPTEVCGEGACRLPAAPRTAFVRSMPVMGALGGIDGADALCTGAAAAAGLTGEYLAWLGAGGATLPLDRLGAADPDAVVRRDGVVIANSIADLVAPHRAPLNLDEMGGVVPPGPVWTGVNVDGGVGELTCDGWTLTTGLGGVGSSAATSGEWTRNGTQACSATARLYCIRGAI